MREALLAAVRARTDREVKTGDFSSVLAPEADDEATALLARVLRPAADPGAPLDLEILAAVGEFHWQRVMGLPVDETDDDLRMAMLVFAPVYEADPDAVPDLLRSFYAEQKPVSAPQEGAVRSGRLDPPWRDAVRPYEQTGDLDALRAAGRLSLGLLWLVSG